MPDRNEAVSAAPQRPHGPFRVGFRFKGKDQSNWLEFESVNLGPTAFIGYEKHNEYTIVPLASVDFIDVREGDND